MSEMQEKKFGYVVHPPHHHCFPPPPGPIPPGMSVKDWTDYINSYIDVRARQIYDKLKRLIPEGGSGSGGVQEVTYTQSSDLGSNARTVGTLNVDQRSTEVKVPTIRINSASQSAFNKPKGPILTFEGIGPGGDDVNVFCEDPIRTIFPCVMLKDRATNRTYSLYMENGELESTEIIPVTD